MTRSPLTVFDKSFIKTQSLTDDSTDNEASTSASMSHNDRSIIKNKRPMDQAKETEPLGYQHYLYDVRIGFSPGGRQSCSVYNEQSLKLKYLPYMIPADYRQFQSQAGSSDRSQNSHCDGDQISEGGISTIYFDPKHIDVTKASCAFLGNSDYVPNFKTRRRRVVIELISAKLSFPSLAGVSANSSYTSLISLAQQSNPNCINSQSADAPSASHPKMNRTNTQQYYGNSPPTSPTAQSSRRFVNYKLLIKNSPGLDKQPAVIERRFSDFSHLYQGLKRIVTLSKTVDDIVSFPKKVYVGNFSLANIAERSIEFSRLLNLCMSKVEFLWSDPFVSFLLDKELREAHRLSLFGDPDDVQILIETAYHIERKLYLRKFNLPFESRSSSSLGNNENVNEQCSLSLDDTETPSYGSVSSNSLGLADSDPIQDRTLINAGTFRLPKTPKSSISLNQRILVTFCMLFLTYYQSEQFGELKIAVGDFTQLVSSQDYVDSLIGTRHYITLRACLLYLMNINHSSVIDDSQRILLKRRLEDIDGANAVFESSPCVSDKEYRLTKNRMKVDGYKNFNRVTKSDLTSLLRDPNFCSFQE